MTIGLDLFGRSPDTPNHSFMIMAQTGLIYTTRCGAFLVVMTHVAATQGNCRLQPCMQWEAFSSPQHLARNAGFLLTAPYH